MTIGPEPCPSTKGEYTCSKPEGHAGPHAEMREYVAIIWSDPDPIGKALAR